MEMRSAEENGSEFGVQRTEKRCPVKRTLRMAGRFNLTFAFFILKFQTPILLLPLNLPLSHPKKWDILGHWSELKGRKHSSLRTEMIEKRTMAASG
jgi:hypothetical protein